MKKRGSKNSPKYPKIHNIEVITLNGMIEQREKERVHAFLKYEARFGDEGNGQTQQYQDMKRATPCKRLPYHN
mgnify:CR=1 FL=1